MFNRRFLLQLAIYFLISITYTAPLNILLSPLGGVLAWCLKFVVNMAVFIIVGKLLPRRTKEEE